MIHHATQSHTPARRANQNPLDRREYMQQAASLAKRGQELPHSKLLDIDVISIRSAVRQRQNLLTYIRDNLSNDALCKQYGVSENVITRVVKYENYGHIA